MKLTILGGGGFRVPLVYQALLGDQGEGRITAVTLYDTDQNRLNAITAVLKQQADAHQAARAAEGRSGFGGDAAPVVTPTTDLDEAIRGADFVFSAIRVGGLEGRTIDERVALDLGVLGQETVGAGGIAYGLRTLPVATAIARRIAVLAPEAWVINFTNPAGMVTESMLPYLGDRVIGICDSPSGLGRRAALALGLDASQAFYDYAGLNHLGWLRGLQYDGVAEVGGDAERELGAALVGEAAQHGAHALEPLGVDVVEDDLVEREPVLTGQQRAVDERDAEPPTTDDRELHRGRS